MKNWRDAVIAVIALSISGCGSIPLRRAPVSSASLPAGSGIVLVSVTSFDNRCMGNGADLAIRTAESGKMVSWLFVQNPYTKSDFREYLGHVYAVALPAGEYAFWLLNESNPSYAYGFEHPHVGHGPHVDQGPHVGHGFRVVAGETRYLGDFWVRGCGYIQTGFRNRWPEVKAKFAKVYPALNLNSVRIDVIRNDTTYGIR